MKENDLLRRADHGEAAYYRGKIGAYAPRPRAWQSSDKADQQLAVEFLDNFACRYRLIGLTGR